MKICLKTKSKEAAMQRQELVLTERLPPHVHKVHNFYCDYQVKPLDNYFILRRKNAATLELNCQRCMQTIDYEYEQESELAICASEEQAESLMAIYEAIALQSLQVDLAELALDDLFLYVPEKHEQLENCKM